LPIYDARIHYDYCTLKRSASVQIMNALHNLTEIASLFRAAESILFITGAGISADSGLPTYRGVGGIYEQMSTADDISIEDALSASIFQERPDITWKYLWQLGAASARAKPNGAHRAIAQLETVKQNVWVMTQNVDGLHRAAGSKQLIEVHGYIFDLTCTKCHRPYSAAEMLHSYKAEVPLPPHCPKCSGVVRPQIVLYEETLSTKVETALAQLGRTSFDLVVSIGTTAVFSYIYRHVLRARSSGVPCVEINPAETDISYLCSHRLRTTAEDAMVSISRALNLGL
jgi:NAD-dependent deacetylase